MVYVFDWNIHAYHTFVTSANVTIFQQDTIIRCNDIVRKLQTDMFLTLVDAYSL